MAGLYIHIPFCSQACHYCDFHFSTSHTLINEISEAIRFEIELQKDYLSGETIDTIYFGGGTPSILPHLEVEKILKTIQDFFIIGKTMEITLEANPEDLSSEKLQSLRQIGINRLSIGIQSFDDDVLRFLNRSHRGKEAQQVIQRSRIAGFENINADLIYAVPGRDTSKLQRDLDVLMELNPEHVSAYSLTIEEKTVFGRRVASKKLSPVSDDLNAMQFELVMDRLTDAGYTHYEISNYAKPGFESQHNSRYWKQVKYLGVGPSAHSFNGVSRQFNIANNNTYLRSLKEKKVPATVEYLTWADQVNEYLMTSLRTRWGCDLNWLKEVHRCDLVAEHRDLIESAVRNELMELKGNILVLTRKGKMHADKLSSDLFLIT